MTNAQFYLEDLKSKFRKINTSEYYLSYSGGKDSHLLYWFIKEYAPEFKDIRVVGINTYMEHEEIRARIYKYCDEVLLPTMKPFDIKAQYGIPCFSKWQDDMIFRYQTKTRTPSLMERIERTTFIGKDGKEHRSRYSLNIKARELLLSGALHLISPKCCYYLKKQPARQFEKRSGLKAVLGVRGNESVMRHYNYKSCFTKDKKFTPLWDMTDEMEKAIYDEFHIEVPKVYEHLTRTGCMGCPYGSWKHDTEKELALLSNAQKKFVCEYFKESYEVLGIGGKNDKS